MKQEEQKYLIEDCEMSSLDVNNGELLEAYFEVVDYKLELIDKLYLRCKPDDGKYVVDPEAMKVNKIDLIKHHEVAKPYKECAFQFVEFLKRNIKGNETLSLIGHSFETDVDFIKAKFGFSKPLWETWISRSSIDTKKSAELLKFAGLMPRDQGGSLTGLCKYFGIEGTEGAHNCIQDVQLTKEVLRNYHRLLTIR